MVLLTEIRCGREYGKWMHFCDGYLQSQEIHLAV